MGTNKQPKALQQYVNRTLQSKQFMEESKKIMPNGVTANIKSFSPYPIVMQKANGAYLEDIDGNQYIDYLLSYGAIMLGHGHPSIKTAILKQWESAGTNLFGTPHQLEVDLGTRIKQYYPSMELLRYTNSGTEATLLSIRLATAYTGKHKIAKFEGHYHGGYDQVLFSINPAKSSFGPAHEPHPVMESKGMDSYHQQNTIILPFNNPEQTAKLLKKYKDELAAVIIEPIQGGFIPATHEFLRELRKLTSNYGIILIFDEVKTGFRIGLGGAQSYYNITPDLTTLGKVIGGGFPIGIVGGKKEILMESAASIGSDVFDSSQSKVTKAQDVLFHSGTYNGHPTILAAGMAVLDELETNMIEVQAITEKLKTGLEQRFSEKGIPMKALGKGTIFSIVMTEKDILNYRDLQLTDLDLRKKLDYLLLNQGIYTKPMNRYSLSIAHGEKEITKTFEAYEKCLKQL